ncbi:HAD-superfamily hydrolase, subfamily IA, variant 1 [Methanococcus aeolicus Nankai-3]|uniref:HAD-superfamily hydrolase, subfamily IA, variant 1 n=1 Tax=Methanococcus aeolicus (strain ATCC BAA-1280 / DSM 17508 / OCM 812 / Nankai-3) TaxID=419665 RepID=A6UU36_META3|nr:HAD family hydrolase [Methanococcus aeolicus]ABR56008.1 HAD-superfamily hydrolase, subfamily IA, variant 1 [Methanococcus aeolicus Nankai-3]
MKAIIFDLDNTLYDYRDYFYQVFLKLSEYFYKRYQIPKDEFIKTSMEILNKRKSRYPKLFNEILNVLNIPENEVKFCVEIFTSGRFPIVPSDGVYEVLDYLKNKNYFLGIITDGNHIRQREKIKSLKFENYFDTVVYTDIFQSPKPSPTPYQYIISKFGINPKLSYYVGDDPDVDFRGAKFVGLNTIRVLNGEFIYKKKNKFIDYEIKEIKEIINIV